MKFSKAITAAIVVSLVSQSAMAQMVVYQQPQVVYVEPQPQVVYVQPAPVYVQPAPVYVEQDPVVPVIGAIAAVGVLALALDHNHYHNGYNHYHHGGW